MKRVIFLKRLKGKIEYVIETMDTNFCLKMNEIYKKLSEDRSSFLFQWFPELNFYAISKDVEKLKFFLIKSLNSIEMF